MSHLIPNTLTQIRNSAAVGKKECLVPFSTYNERLLQAIKAAGYVGEIETLTEGPHRSLRVNLIPGKIRRIKLVSKPGRRVYVGYREIPVILNGFGVVVMSTPKGIMTGDEAKSQQLGGEIICELA